MNPSLTEKTMGSQTIYSGKLFDVVKAQVQLPNGRQTIREVVKHPGAVAIIPLLDSEIILVRQYRQAINKITIELPAGTLNVGENPEECARRELIEETGYTSGHLRKIFQCYLAPGYSSELVHVYLATDLIERRQETDDDEFIDVVKISFPSVMQMIQKNVIEDTKTIAAVLYLKQYVLTNGEMEFKI